MAKKNDKMLIVASFEDASILRKFTILFLAASIIPLLLLYYIYLQDQSKGSDDPIISGYGFAVLLTAVGVLAGYLSMRSLLVKIIDITKENRKSIENFLSPETVKELNRGENEIVMLSRSFSAVTQKLEENIRSLETAKRTLQSVMSKVGQGISNMENINTFLQLIVETMTNALNGKAGALMILSDPKTLTINTVHGLQYDAEKPLQLNVERGSSLMHIIESKKPQKLPQGLGQNTNNLELNALFARPLLCVPLVCRERVSGVMVLSKDDAQQDFTDEDMGLLFNLATQTAVALENSNLNRDIEKTYFETISALALAVDAKDKYSRGHLDRVADYALMIGRKMGLSENDLNTLRDAARLHDLGKIGIPDEILRKEGQLTEEEWIIMRRHPEIGESIIKPVRSLQHLCDLIRHHHERLDGKGYPDGLKEEEISPLVRILTVADIYDALTTERSYRPKKTKHQAAEILRSMKYHVDQSIVEIFLEGLPK